MNPLSLFRRHGLNCEAKRPADSYTTEIEERRHGFKRCSCKIYAHGTLNGVSGKAGTRQREWDLARLFIEPYLAANSWDAAKPVLPPPPPGIPPSPGAPPPARSKTLFSAAVDRCLRSQRAMGCAENTVSKYVTVLRGEQGLERFAQARGVRFVEDFTPALARELAESWEVTPATRRAKMSPLKVFFELQVEDGVIASNPARIRFRKNRSARGGARDSAPARHSFSDAELKRMMDGCADFGRTEILEGPRRPGSPIVSIRREYARKFDGGDLADFIQLSCHTGLRFMDVAKFHIDRLTPSGEVKLRAAKNGVWVLIQLPAHLQKMIRNRAARSGPYIFGDPRGRNDNNIYVCWNRRLKKLWAETGPYEHAPVHHRFRHSFVRMLLQQGTPISVVARLAGDSEETIRRHYSNWIPELQEAASEALRKALAGFPRFLRA